MKTFKKFLRFSLRVFFGIIVLFILYFGVAFICTSITVNKDIPILESDKNIYISTNGVHLDLIFPKEYLTDSLQNQLSLSTEIQYVSFGWGDKQFYINTPEWKDLTAKNAFNALFLKSETLLHITEHNTPENDWVQVPIDKGKLKILLHYIDQSFSKNENGNIQILPNQGYDDNDKFYEANGSYSIFFTCNTWVNKALKQSDLKSCLWTPFDYGVLNIYK